MLTLYYARPSLFARPAWLALLEKQLEFELIPMKLNGDQFEPQFRALNPFSHVPVLVDNNFRVIELAAILDYLEAKYPQPALAPTTPEALAQMKMLQSIALSELLPAIAYLIIHPNNTEDYNYAVARSRNVLNFYESQLTTSPYFVNNALSYADIVAGTLVPMLPRLGFSLTEYPQLHAWYQQLLQRETWQQIELTSTEFTEFQRGLRVLAKVWKRRRRQRQKTWAKDTHIST